MSYIIQNDAEKKNFLSVFEKQAKVSSKEPTILYIKLGSKIVKVLCYSDEFIPHIQKQLTFSLLKESSHYDATLVLWKENDFSLLYKELIKSHTPLMMRNRLESVRRQSKRLLDKNFSFIEPWFTIFDYTYSKHIPLMFVYSEIGIARAYDEENNIFYYGIRDLSPEEFIKHGHIFVQFFNKIIKSETANLAHGAVIGIDNKGILLCARGQRGKSTLTVLSMIEGFEYVSDDYLIFEKEGNELYSDPIYSIITLSPRMYNELYDKLENSRFVSNNARKDKYVINIANFHKQFKTKYPIKCCLFPEIVSDPEPSICPCSLEEKGRAIVQLIHSTVMQLEDITDRKTIKLLFTMVKDFTFYKFNLCNDINKNTEFLKNYIQHLDNKKDICEFPPVIEDVTFELANFINTQTFTICSMNKFATNIYENLKSGVTRENILTELLLLDNISDCEKQLDMFIHVLKDKKLFSFLKHDDAAKPFINKDAVIESQHRMSVIEFREDEVEELIKL